MIIYANKQIKRENSPIENVVLDLSCNLGGAEDAVAFVCSWFLGRADIYMQNSMPDAASVSVYSCDANLDHKFDEKDTGIDPDFPLTKIESYYDRKALTEYINSLK